MGTTPSKEDSLGKRYLFKLVSNAASIPLFFVMEALVPRALGPALYGNFNFATNLFQQCMGFLDMGTSTCLHNSLSRRQGEFGLVVFYVWFSLGILLLCLSFGGLALVPGLSSLLLPGVPTWLILPAAFWAFLGWGGRVVRGVNDALGITARSEIVRMVVNTLSALILAGLFFLGWLTLPVLFVHQYIFFILFILGFCLTLRGAWARPCWQLSRKEVGEYAREFTSYSGPLFTMALCSALFLAGERWLLQWFGGSVAQGYFSLSQKVGMACFMFVTAMTPLLMRELAVAHGNNDTKAMGRLLDRYAPMLYAVAGYFSCFTLVEAETVTKLFGGSGFADAMLPVQIMALYPMHQGYGQVANSVYYATGQTKALRNFTLYSLLVGLGTAWVLIAPMPLCGLGLGATGLACKMVGVQFVAVNTLLFFCRRIVPFAFMRNLAHQIVCPLVFIALACVGKAISSQLAVSSGIGPESWLMRIGVSGLIYSVLFGGAVLAFPALAGLGRGELKAMAQRLAKRQG